jgi:hypothetical protein
MINENEPKVKLVVGPVLSVQLAICVSFETAPMCQEIGLSSLGIGYGASLMTQR